jgi:hypothetical protein
MSTAGHGGDEIVHSERPALRHGSDAPIAQHGAAIGDGHHLVESMRDIDDGGAARLHAGQHREQPLDLALLQRGGRLVEHEHAALPVQRLGDGDQLALGEAQRAHAPLRIDTHIELGQRGARVLPHARSVDQRERSKAAHREIAERDILGDRQRRHQPQLLRDGNDAGGDGVARAGEMAGLAGDENIAAVGTMHTAEDADERRLAGAVLADNGVDLAERHVEVDAVERGGRAELLADASDARRGMTHRFNAART